MEPFRFKIGSPKRGNAWTQIADILNTIPEPKFRVNQRSVRDRYNLLEKTFKRKITEEEKGSGINPPELTDIERGIQEVMEKSKEVQNAEDTGNADKAKAEEMRRMSMETFSETRDRLKNDEGSPRSKRKRGNGSETFSFLMNRAEVESEHKKEELRLKAEQLAIQKQEAETQRLLLTQQQEQNQQIMLMLMNAQQQQTQLFNALIDKLNTHK